MLFKVLVIIGMIVMLLVMLKSSFNCPKEKQTQEKIELRSFKLKDLKEAEDFYYIRVESKGQEKWKKLPKDRTKRYYVGQNYHRVDVVKITRYDRRKCYLKEAKRTEVSYKIFASKNISFPKK